MRRRTELPPLPPRTRQRGRKPHDPRFDVRTALLLRDGSGPDRHRRGFDELHALTLVSELGTDFTKWPDGKAFCQLAGVVSQLAQDRGKGEVEPARVEAERAAHACGWGVEPDAEFQRPGAYPRPARIKLIEESGLPVRKSVFSNTAIILPGLLSLMGVRFNRSPAKRRSQLRLLARSAPVCGFRPREIHPAPNASTRFPQ